RLTPQFCSPGTQRPKGPERERSEPEKERARGRRRTRAKESESSPGGPLQPITPAGLLSLWVHTASDCPPPSLSSLPIHTETPEPVPLFSRLCSEKCFSDILSFSARVSLLLDGVSVIGGLLHTTIDDCCINTRKDLCF
ncbi:unnamed protein product, partial [Tetraodon nigroviridis]